MNQHQLEQQASALPTAELREALSWNESLSEHYDDNMDFGNYELAQTKINVIKAELARRGN